MWQKRELVSSGKPGWAWALSQRRDLLEKPLDIYELETTNYNNNDINAIYVIDDK